MYRGGLCTTVLEYALRESWGEDAIGRVAGGHIRAIETCRGLSWLPASDLDALNHASLATAGREGYVDFWRRYTARAKESILFGPLASGAFRIFGSRPEGFLRWVGRAWDATTRNYGTIKCAGGPGSAKLALIDIPPGCRLPSVAASLEGSIYGVLDLCQHEGRVETDETRLKSHGIVDVHATWEQALP